MYNYSEVNMISSTAGQDEIISKVPSQKPWLKIFISVFFVVIAIWLFLPILQQWTNGIPSIDSKTVTSATVFKGTLIRDVAVNGKLVAANAPTLYSSEAGQVTLLKKPGDIVEKGDIVASVLSPELQSIIQQATAKLESLRIDVRRGELRDLESQIDLEQVLDTARVRSNASKRELARAELSFEKQVVSELYLVSQRDENTENQLLLQHAQKRVELAIKRLEFENKTREIAVESQQLVVDELRRRVELLSIRTPVNGIVGNWLVQKKERVNASQPVMTIVDLSLYEAEINVPEFYADDLGLGLDVKMTISGKSLVGKIISISPEVKNNQVIVRVSVVNKEELQLRQNQRLNARIEFENKENVLMVKRGSFQGSHGGQAVYLINGNNASLTPISIGSQSVEHVEIVSGLKVDDSIIISSTELFDAHSTILLN